MWHITLSSSACYTTTAIRREVLTGGTALHVPFWYDSRIYINRLYKLTVGLRLMWNCLYSQEIFDYSHVRGHAIMHRGHHRHGARATTTGDRINLLLWCRRYISLLTLLFCYCKIEESRIKTLVVSLVSANYSLFFLFNFIHISEFNQVMLCIWHIIYWEHAHKVIDLLFK